MSCSCFYPRSLSSSLNIFISDGSLAAPFLYRKAKPMSLRLMIWVLPQYYRLYVFMKLNLSALNISYISGYMRLEKYSFFKTLPRLQIIIISNSQLRTSSAVSYINRRLLLQVFLKNRIHDLYIYSQTNNFDILSQSHTM